MSTSDTPVRCFLALARALRRAAATALALVAIAPTALAYDPVPSWVPFGQLPGSQGYGSPAADLSFARQWEANPPKGFATLSAENLNATKAAIKRYADVVERGGFKTVPEIQLQIGSSHAAVGILRERLVMSGDLKDAPAGYGSEMFGQELERAVKRFQASNGLTPTGVVDKRTIAALNVPAAARLRQLRTNFTRLSDLSRSSGKRYIMVNIPAAQMEIVDNDKVVSRHSAVVGKIDRQTPILKSAVH